MVKISELGENSLLSLRLIDFVKDVSSNYANFFLILSQYVGRLRIMFTSRVKCRKRSRVKREAIPLKFKHNMNFLVMILLGM